jgi:hypothetical protein
MTTPEIGQAGATPPGTSRGREAPPLALVVVLWIVVGTQHTLGGDTTIADRGGRIAGIEADWTARLAEADSEEVYGKALERIDRYRDLTARGWGDRSWRLRYRASKPTRPLAPPTGFKATLDAARAVIVLTWTPPEGADVVIIYGRRAPHQGVWEHRVTGASDRWEDELFELAGTYT